MAFPNCVTAGPSGAVAHAVSRGATLCGIPVRRATTTPGCFAPDAASACPRCVQRAAATPGRPSPQELLHDKILAADAGPLRDALVEALKQGAPVHPWIRGASAGNVRSSVRLYGAMEGARQADEALRTEGPFGAAEVVTAARRFVVIMPRYTRPVIAARSVRPVAQTPSRPASRRRRTRRPAVQNMRSTATRRCAASPRSRSPSSVICSRRSTGPRVSPARNALPHSDSGPGRAMRIPG
ncbi:hypothetical protein GCM10027610_108520 [Dactylosporangium cerinum]